MLATMPIWAIASAVYGQWQTVVPGIEYRQYSLTAPDPAPNNVFVARMDRANTNCIIDSCLAQGKLQTTRETVTGMANRYEDTLNYWGQTWGARSDVVVAINGSGFTSDPGPTGGQVISGWQAKRFPEYGGSGFCWKLDRSCFLGGDVRNADTPGHEYQYIYFANAGYAIPTNVNAARNGSLANELIVYSTQFGDNTGTDSAGTEVLVEMSRPLVSLPKGSAYYVLGTVRQVRVNAGSTPIPFDHVVLSGKGTYANILAANCAVGDELRFQFEIHDYGTGGQVPTGPSDWTKAYASISCFAYVVKNGIVPVNDWTGNANLTTRQPRTAVAFNDSYVYFLVCDGRSAQSVGMTYPELGNFCVNYLGATWATNQDGGGSSAIWVNGQIKNVPSDGSERAVANGLMMVAVQPKQQSSAFVTGQVVRTSTTANVRLGPGTNYGILTTVANNTQGNIVEHSIKGVYAKGFYWWKVNFSGTEGWVAESLLIGGGIPPAVTQHPQPQTIAPGATATFTVTATGDAPLAYQWQKNQANLTNGGHYAGVTTATLTVSNADINDLANYRCVVSNAYGNATSNEAALTLTGTPTITQHPQPQNVCTGGTATFTVTASGAGTLTYRWQKNGANLSDGGHYAGTTTATLTVSPADTGDVASYRCAVTNASGTTFSNAAPLTINAVYSILGLGAGTISGMSTDGSVVAGNSASGGFIWSQANGVVGLGAGTTTAGVGIKNGTVVVGGLAGGNAARWDGTTAGAGSWTQLPLVGGTTAWTPLCTSAQSGSPGNVFIGGNSNGSTGQKSAVRYKESSASTTSLPLPSSGNKDAYIYGISDAGSYAGRYQYGATSPSGSRQAMGGATLTALSPLIGPPSTGNEGVANTISRDGTKAGGWSTSLTSSRQGTIWTIANPTVPAAVPFLSGDDYAEVQSLNGDGSTAGGYSALAGNVAGTKKAFLWDAANGTRNLQTLLTTQYGLDLTGWTLQEVKAMSSDGKVLAGNGLHNGAAEAWIVFLGVAPLPPVITQQPAAQNVCPGATAAFTTAATAQGTPSWQWQKNGINLADGGHYAGATTATLTITNADAADAADYRCVVSIGCASTTSNAATLTVRAATTITQHPAPQSVCPGSPATFTVAAAGEGVVSCQWQRDGANLSDGSRYSGTATPTLSISNADVDIAGVYRCVATAACGTAVSDAAPLIIRTVTSVSQHPAPVNTCAGGTAQFGVLAAGDGTITYQWQKNGTDLADGGRYSGTTTETLTITGAAAEDRGNYRCVVAAGCGTATSQEAALTLGAGAADADDDCDVDLADFTAFQSCFNGPNRPAAQPGCEASDFDADSDVDLADFTAFQACFNGPNQPPACL